MKRHAIFMLGGSDKASSAIEFALLAPVLLFFLIAALDFGLGMARSMAVAWAVQAGAQYASMHQFDQTAIKAAVQSASQINDFTFSPQPTQFCGCADSSSALRTVSCTTTCSNGKTAGTYVSVTAQSLYSTLFSYPGLPATFTLSASATVRIK